MKHPRVVLSFLVWNSIMMLMSGQTHAEIQAPPAYKVEVFASNLNIPTGLRININNELLVVEAGNDRILRFTPDGSLSVYADSGPGAPLDFTTWYVPPSSQRWILMQTEISMWGLWGRMITRITPIGTY